MRHPTPKEGDRHGMVVVIAVDVARSLNRRSILDRVRCDCGTEKAVLRNNLVRQGVHSCGCQFFSKPKHGHAMQKKSPTYQIWLSMRKRCLQTSYREYHLYGGRGIKICGQWKDSFEQFLADMGERPTGMTLDRIDNEGHYEASNCRWAAPKEQTLNRRATIWVEIGGRTQCLGDWARELNLSLSNVYYAVRKRGLSPKEALGLKEDR